MAKNSELFGFAAAIAEILGTLTAAVWIACLAIEMADDMHDLLTLRRVVAGATAVVWRRFCFAQAEMGSKARRVS